MWPNDIRNLKSQAIQLKTLLKPSKFSISGKLAFQYCYHTLYKNEKSLSLFFLATENNHWFIGNRKVHQSPLNSLKYTDLPHGWWDHNPSLNLIINACYHVLYCRRKLKYTQQTCRKLTMKYLFGSRKTAWMEVIRQVNQRMELEFTTPVWYIAHHQLPQKIHHINYHDELTSLLQQVAQILTMYAYQGASTTSTSFIQLGTQPLY